MIEWLFAAVLFWVGFCILIVVYFAFRIALPQWGWAWGLVWVVFAGHYLLAGSAAILH